MSEKVAKILKEEFPDSPEAECFRFAQATRTASEYKESNKEKRIQATAIQNLEAYHDWRSCYGIDFDRPSMDNDECIWEWAVEKAMSATRARDKAKQQELEAKKALKAKRLRKDEDQTIKVDYDTHIDEVVREEETEVTKGDNTSDESSETVNGKAGEQQKGETTKQRLPQIIFKRFDPKTGEIIRDIKGDPIFHVLAARIDRFAARSETWALAISLYLDCHFDRNSKDLFGLLIDARAGDGWANPKLLMVLSLTRVIINSVNSLHPGRWRTIIIFPLPRVFLGIWNTVKGYFHPETAAVIKLVSGQSHLGSPLPKGDLEVYIEDDVLDFLEDRRNELYDMAAHDDDN